MPLADPYATATSVLTASALAAARLFWNAAFKQHRNISLIRLNRFPARQSAEAHSVFGLALFFLLLHSWRGVGLRSPRPGSIRFLPGAGVVLKPPALFDLQVIEPALESMTLFDLVVRSIRQSMSLVSKDHPACEDHLAHRIVSALLSQTRAVPSQLFVTVVRAAQPRILPPKRAECITGINPMVTIIAAPRIAIELR